MNCDANLTGVDLGGLVLAPGVYCFATTAQLTGQLILDGPSDGVWVFVIGTALTTAAGAEVSLNGNAQAGNVYWRTGTSFTFGATNQFKGNLVAGVSVTMGAGTTLNGRVQALTAVTMDNNDIYRP
jgi:hypothetical protein